MNIAKAEDTRYQESQQDDGEPEGSESMGIEDDEVADDDMSEEKLLRALMEAQAEDQGCSKHVVDFL